MSGQNEIFGKYVNPSVHEYNGALEEDPRLAQLHNDICRLEIEDFYTPIQRLYFDIGYLRDFELGSVVACTSSEEIPLITRGLPGYNERIRDEQILSFFPGLSVSEDSLQRIAADREYDDALLLKSPTTNMYESLVPFCEMILKQNSRIQARVAVKVCINFYPYKPSTLVKNFYARVLQQIHPSFTLTVMSHPLHTVPKDVLLPNNQPFFQIMCIRDLISFVRADSTVCREFLEELRFAKTFMYAPKRIDPEIQIGEDAFAPSALFRTTEALLQLCCNFKYFNPLIPVTSEDVRHG